MICTWDAMFRVIMAPNVWQIVVYAGNRKATALIPVAWIESANALVWTEEK